MAVICRICKQIKELHEFVKHNQHKNGYDTKCKVCHVEYNKRYKTVRRKENSTPKIYLLVDKKYCNTCFIEKSISEFQKSFYHKDSYRNKCTACSNNQIHDLREARLRLRLNQPINIECRDCYKPFNSLDYNVSQLKFKKPRCKSCAIANAKRYKYKKSASTQCLLPEKEYQILLRKQNYVCAICKREEKRKSRNVVMRLSVDHCHNSEKIRGLLCARCNLAIGQFEDNVELLRFAADYLDSHNAIT